MPITATATVAPPPSHPHEILKTHLEAVEGAFGGAIDYAMLIKQYGNPADGDRSSTARYSTGHCTGVHVVHVSGRPDITKINTSYVERHNLTMRMSWSGTNAFSKSEPRRDGGSLHVRLQLHQAARSLKKTPARGHRRPTGRRLRGDAAEDSRAVQEEPEGVDGREP